MGIIPCHRIWTPDREVLPVDDKRQSRGGVMWYEAVLAAYRERLAGGLAAS